MDDFNDAAIFQQLLTEVAAVFLRKNAAFNPKMGDWKGAEITAFQEDLRAKVGTGISEKWFYTYVKHKQGKLPRIDVLNLLSRYAGYRDWHQFKVGVATGKKKKAKGHNLKRLSAMAAIIGLISLTVYALMPKTNTFHFCFMDADKKERITNISIDIVILNGTESPDYQKTDSLGCVAITTKNDFVRFIARSPYHKTDTVYRSVEEKTAHEVRLRTDDYALMLHYYGNNKVKDWKKRRSELQKLIADDAIIFELLPDQLGVELYDKKDFIDKLTTPTTTLQRLQVVETRYADGRITKLKFKINAR